MRSASRTSARPLARNSATASAATLAPLRQSPARGRLIRAVDREIAARAVAACILQCGVDPNARALMLARRFQRADAGMKHLRAALDRQRLLIEQRARQLQPCRAGLHVAGMYG